MSDAATPGFAGLLLQGWSPHEAWAILRQNLIDDPLALAVVKAVKDQPGGDKVIAEVVAQWAQYDLPVPWEGL